MSKAHIRLYSYQNILTQNIIFGQTTRSTRDGLILHIIDNEGKHGTGDIAPLVFFSNETLPQAEAEIRMVMEAFANSFELETMVAVYLEKQSTLSPSVQFGIESALNCIRHQKENPGEILFTNAAINALIQNDSMDLNRLIEDGYSSFKIKVGQLSIQEEISRINAMTSTHLPPKSIRLDANQAWSFDDACIFWDGLKNREVIEYIEEPLQNPSLLKKLYLKTNMPIALDESLREKDWSRLPFFQGIDAIVYKPTLMGGKSTLLRLMSHYELISPKFVLSSSYESGIGLMNIARMNLKLLNNANPMGIDTYRYLQTDILNESLLINKGRLEAILTPSHQRFFNKNKMNLLHAVHA